MTTGQAEGSSAKGRGCSTSLGAARASRVAWQVVPLALAIAAAGVLGGCGTETVNTGAGSLADGGDPRGTLADIPARCLQPGASGDRAVGQACECPRDCASGACVRGRCDVQQPDRDALRVGIAMRLGVLCRRGLLRGGLHRSLRELQPARPPGDLCAGAGRRARRARRVQEARRRRAAA